MYRITDPHHPGLADSIRQAVNQCFQKHPQSAVYALMDATLDQDWAQQLWHAAQTQPDQVQSVYQDTPLAELEECSLFVGCVAGNELQPLLQRSQAAPMLSFIQTNLSLDQLRQHLARFARARTTDGQWLVARWGCPVVAVTLLNALTPAQQAQLFSGFAAWYLINREGGVDTLVGSNQPFVPGDPDHSEDQDVASGMLEHGYAMSDAAFASVVDAGEADALLSALGQQLPQALGARPASLLHTMANQVLGYMNELGIAEGQDRIHLLAHALNQPTAQAARDLLQAHHDATQTAAA